jgi:hypothetical protein
MALLPACPRCPDAVEPLGGAFVCGLHGSVPPLWRPLEPSYDAFGEHLRAAEGLPTYLPWPMSPGWRVSDFGVVGEPSREPRATVSACSGPSDLDGPVDVLVVTEEPGTGLGARCAGLVSSDPGPEVGLGPAMARVRVGGQPVPLWPVSTAEADPAGDRTVLAGEAFGRWLWLVLQPASALLLLRDEWQLEDVSQVGPQLVELAFGGPAPGW